MAGKKPEVKTGRIFTGANLREIAFPLGGIGTGTVSLTGNGGLREWQVRNKPDQLSLNPLTFFALWARPKGEDSVARVLEGPVPKPFHKHQYGTNGSSFHPGGGLGNSGVPGLPRMKEVTFRGEYPFAHLDMTDPAVPLDISLEAYNPLIPMNADDSGIPCAIFNWTLKNRTRKVVSVTLAMSMQSLLWPTEKGGSRNRAFEEKGISGIEMDNTRRKKSDPENGTVCIATPWRRTISCAAWPRLGWFDALQNWWDTFSAKGALPESAPSPAAETPRHPDPCTLGLRTTLKPGESVTMPVWVCWSFPVFEKYWGRSSGCCEKVTWKNYYAKRFPSARSVVDYLKAEGDRLYAESNAYREALFSSTLPDEVLDAVSSQVSVMRSPTCLRLPDGTFYGFEGCHCTGGCCEGSCTHVWNYQQVVPFLFPELQRSMREAYYKYGFSQTGSGAIHFRLGLPLQQPKPKTDERPEPPRPAADGQLGGITQVYRDWKITGDTRWLKRIWPSVKKSLEFAWDYWDYNKRGVPDGLQHNTYDIEFYGPNTLVGSMYLAALKAGEEMALAVGEPDRAEEYRAVREKGAAWIDKQLFDGEYYIQKVDFDAYKYAEKPHPKPVAVVPGMKPGEPRYQYGKGCLSDQLLGQTNAHVAGLGYVLDPEHVKSAIASVFNHNFREDLWDHECCQRVYSLQDESALVLCSWPKGGRPALPFPYSDEAGWTGIEYQVAAHLIYEGLVGEGLRVVRAVRDRYDGERRNPWNEYECGSYYARAMASHGLLLALGGFKYDGTCGMLGFEPRLDGEAFRTFWSAQRGWGVYTKERAKHAVEVHYGDITLQRLEVGVAGTNVRARVNGKSVKASVEEGAIVFAEAQVLKAGDAVSVSVS